MPVRSKRPCKKFGCKNLAEYPHRYCKEHLELEEKENAERNDYYDKNIRDKKRNEFYHSKEWIKLRAYTLSKYKGLDLYEYYVNNKLEYASTIHHVEEVKDNWSRRLDITNLIPVSERTHNTIHALYNKDKLKTQELLFNLIRKWREEIG